MTQFYVMLNAGKIATGMKPIYILFLFSVLPHTPTTDRRPWGPAQCLPFSVGVPEMGWEKRGRTPCLAKEPVSSRERQPSTCAVQLH